MKALLSLAPGPAETLVLKEIPDPVPGPTQVVVRVQACGVNYPDALHLEDRYQVKLPRPFSPGGEVCGIVASVGAAVRDLSVGDKVIGRCGSGGMAQKLAIDADRCVAIPAEASSVEAAALVYTYATDYYALVDRAALKAGETMLVLGAAGGVGSAAIDLGKALGARVVAAASSPEKLAFAMSCGADDGIVYPGSLEDKDAQKAFANALKALVGPGGADVVFDPVGGAYSEPALRAIARYGRHLIIGFTAGIPRLPTNLILLKVCQVVGVDWRDLTENQPQDNARNVREVVRLWQAGRIRPRVSRTFTLAQAPEALHLIGHRGALGKLVVTID